jgi:polysaccharide pyruvyl transferase WcaK-like protein
MVLVVTGPSSNPQRVLLIGAYANGNVGDMYQADAIARELLEVDPTLEIFSTSPSKRLSKYPTSSHKALPQSAVRNSQVLNSFDLILVGGGGLLAAPHAPLPDAAWVNSIETTICGLAIGCAGTAPAEARTFVEKCQRFSVRDEFSAQFIASMRKDVEIILDPIFLSPLPALEIRPASVATRGIMWIPGKLVQNTLDFYTRLCREAYSEKADLVASLNQETDKQSGFGEMFGADVHYLQNVDRFADLLRPKSFSISERYHGCILALKMGVPCFGLVLRSDTVTSKITELYRKLNLTRALVRDSGDLSRKHMNTQAKNDFDFAAIAAIARRERTKLHEFLRACLLDAGKKRR